MSSVTLDHSLNGGFDIRELEFLVMRYAGWGTIAASIVWGTAAAGCSSNTELFERSGGAAAATGVGGQGLGGGSGGGVGGACNPGVSESCYSGPDGTEGVGVCHAGARICLSDGSAFGPCGGEVTAGPDDCTTRGGTLKLPPHHALAISIRDRGGGKEANVAPPLSAIERRLTTRRCEPPVLI